MAKRKSPVDQMLDEIRALVANYAEKMTESAMYEALVEESTGWKMRLEELDDDENLDD